MASRKAWCFVNLFLILSSCCCEENNENGTNEELFNVEEAEVTEDQGVLVLTTKNFDSVIKKYDIILVEFYAPWCGHCKALAPEFANAAHKLKKNDPPVPLAKVDCTQEEELSNRFGIQGYPTLKIFKGGEAIDYDGPRQEDGIVTFMKERADPNWKPPPPAVVVLTKDNFDEITNREEMMLVEFFAPSCGHCKQLAPQLEKAAQKLMKREKPILIGIIDATVEMDLGEKYHVTGFPTMFTFRKGKHSEYKGPSDAEGIADYLVKHSGLPTTHHKTLKDVKNFLKSNFHEPVILGVFESEEDTLYSLFIDANNDLRDDFTFGHTFSKDVMKYIGVKKSAIVVAHPEHLVSKQEPRFRIYQDQDGTPSDVKEFYIRHQVPLVGFYQQHTVKYFNRRPLVVVFYDVNFDLEYRSITQFWRNKVVTVAKEFPDVLFAVAEEDRFEDKLKDLGLSESGEDVNVAIYDHQERRYAMVDEEFDEDSLRDFVKNYLDGKLKPIIKSQPVLPRVKPGTVQPVVGQSFDDIVMGDDKEVFIEFYAPWCGHCKAIENSIIDLAVEFKKEKDIIIAKIDGSANEAPSPYKVEGFPTIYYAVPGKKHEPVKLDGPRDPESLRKFIKENSNILKKREGKTEL